MADSNIATDLMVTADYVPGVVSPRSILSGLASQQSTGELCDVTLEVEGKQIHAHRGVLAAASPGYFHSMFLSNFMEKNQKVIKLQEVSYEGLCIVVECIYKSTLKLTNETVGDVLATANLMQITDIVDECHEYMMNTLDTQSCLRFHALAEKYSFDDVIDKTTAYFLKHFVDVSKTPEFVEMSKDALINLLSDDCLNFEGNELEVFKAAQTWLEADPERTQYVMDVIQNIRFMLITSDTLDDLLDLSIIENNEECQRLIRDAIKYHSKVYEQSLHCSPQNRPRGKKDIVTIDGGCRAYAETWKNARKESKIYFHTAAPNAPGQRLSATFSPALVYRSMTGVQFNNFLFVFGLDNETFAPISLRYDASVDKWIELKAMPGPRTVEVASTLNGTDIYLIGGREIMKKSPYPGYTQTPRHTEIRNTAYRYNISKNTWKKLPGTGYMPRESARAGACSANGVVYLSGGLTLPPYKKNESSSDKLFAFDPEAQLWYAKRSMAKARCGHRMECVGDKLYVIGGDAWYMGPLGGTWVGEIEMYYTVTEQWVTLAEPMRACFCEGMSIVDGDKIFLLGGQSDGFHRIETSDIYVFDTVGNTLEEYDKKLPQIQSGHVCGLLTLPLLL